MHKAPLIVTTHQNTMDIAWYKNAAGECIINLYNLILEEQIKHTEREALKDILLYTWLFHKNIYKVYML